MPPGYPRGDATIRLLFGGGKCPLLELQMLECMSGAVGGAAFCSCAHGFRPFCCGWSATCCGGSLCGYSLPPFAMARHNFLEKFFRTKQNRRSNRIKNFYTTIESSRSQANARHERLNDRAYPHANAHARAHARRNMRGMRLRERSAPPREGEGEGEITTPQLATQRRAPHFYAHEIGVRDGNVTERGNAEIPSIETVEGAHFD